jgi:hypothetical protein
MMRGMILLLGLLLVAGCVNGTDSSRIDPNLYDASGNLAAAMPPPPAPAPAAPECREVERSVTIGGQAQRAYANACRQPDGSWRFTN